MNVLEFRENGFHPIRTSLELPSQDLAIAVCQMTSTDDIAQNIDQVKRLTQTALTEGRPRWISFPENALYLRTREGEVIRPFDLESGQLDSLKDLCSSNKIFIHLGSVPLFEKEKLFNATLLITDQGQAVPVYQKIHLFDVDIEGLKPLRESDVFAWGDQPVMTSVDGWFFGFSICYDLRFSELYSLYAQLGVHVLLVPSAFTVPTGKDHWHILLRARAIESQAYLLAAAQGGTHIGKEGGRRHTYGHSLAVDPWGIVLGEIAEGSSQSVISISLRADRLKQVRQQIPMAQHRRI